MGNIHLKTEEVFLDLSTKDMDGLKMQTALRMKKNAAEKRCDYYSDKNTKVMMIEKKNYWFVCNEVETGAQLVIFKKNINLHVTGQLLSIMIIYHYYYMAHTQKLHGAISVFTKVLPPNYPI